MDMRMRWGFFLKTPEARRPIEASPMVCIIDNLRNWFLAEEKRRSYTTVNDISWKLPKLEGP